VPSFFEEKAAERRLLIWVMGAASLLRHPAICCDKKEAFTGAVSGLNNP
jgi:hypothetical protein